MLRFGYLKCMHWAAGRYSLTLLWLQKDVLLSLDISAAIDTVVHSTLLDRASSDFGIDGVALD